MDVRTRDNRGQSVLEFLLALPILVAFIMTLIKVNTAIQVSIVNQQYARQQALYLAFNSPDYPENKYRQYLSFDNSNQFMLGVTSVGVSAEDEDTIRSVATVEDISGFPGLKGNDANHEIPTTRTRVRVRTTVSLCTTSIVLASGSAGSGSSLILPGGHNLMEGSDFAFCNPDKSLYGDVSL